MTESVGQQLLQARLERGVSIEDASQATHIRPRFLQALEADDPGSLPSLVQGRGFLRLYADFLGLDSRPLLDAFAGRPAQPAEPVSQAVTVPVPVSLSSSAEPAAPLPEAAPPPVSPDALEALLEPEAPAGIPEPAPEPGPETPAPAAVESPKDHAQTLFRRSQGIYDAIGGDLRAQRERLSLSLSDVEQYTRLRTHYLEALEEGRMQDLPSPVQGRGMLANYARFLNLDADAFLLRFADALQARREGMVALQAQPSQKQAPRVVSHPTLKRVLSIDLLVTSGLILLFIGFIIWGASQVLSQRTAKGKTTPTPPSVSEVLLSTPGTAASSGEILTATLSSTDSGEAVTATGTPGAEATVPSSGDGAIQVYVVAQQPAWMRVTVDGKEKFSGRLIRGNAYPYSGDEQVEVLTGNAAGLQVFYNAQDLGSLGKIGQVVDLIFTKSGVVTPTAAVPPAPTSAPATAGTPTKTVQPTLATAPKPTGTAP